MSESKKLYTEEQLRLSLLEQSNTGVLRALKHLDGTLSNLDSKVDRHFHWTLGILVVLFVSLYGTLATALAKSFNWF